MEQHRATRHRPAAEPDREVAWRPGLRRALPAARGHSHGRRAGTKRTSLPMAWNLTPTSAFPEKLLRGRRGTRQDVNRQVGSQTESLTVAVFRRECGTPRMCCLGSK